MAELFDVVIVTEPEAVMASDVFPSGTTIMAVGEAVGGEATFGSVGDLLAARAVIEAGKAARVEPWQLAVGAPCFVARDVGGMTVYGRLWAWREMAAKEMSTGADWNDVDALRVRAESALARGWLWGMWWSTLVPDGELGHCHRADIGAVITADEFKAVRAAGWPDR